jgi:hypothetical protein
MMQPPLPSYDPSEDQALVVFDHAAEEIRFFKGQQWNVTNYTLAAYAALVATASFAWPDGWRLWVSILAVALVFVAGGAAWKVLVSLERALNKERRRQHAARDILQLLKLVHEQHPPGRGPDMPKDWSLMSAWCKLWSPGIFVAVLLFGAFIATLISISLPLSSLEDLSAHRPAGISQGDPQ